MSRAARKRRIGLTLLIGAVCLPALPIIDRLTHHPDEAIILLMPPALCALLWWGWPVVRRTSWRQYALYLAVLVPVIAGAELFAAHMAMGRILWAEVFWAVYFVIAWRAAWAVWKRTIGRLGERHRRWARRARVRAGGLSAIADARKRRLAAVLMLVGPVRFCLVAFVFVPLVAGSLIHRIKVGNPSDLGPHADLPIEEVTFRTDDGLTISGWFLPERHSDSTVVICHGAGANKHNFIYFLTLFHGQGYSGLIFDFRGHGDSDGHTSTFGLMETAEVRAAVDWLKAERPDYARHVYGLGSSMGAMALVRAAARDDRIEAVVLDSCFVSAPTFVHHHLGRVPLIGGVVADLILASASLHAGASFWGLDARESVKMLSPRPVLFIHGEDDVVVPPTNMATLYDLTGLPKDRWLGPGPHSNVLTTDFGEYQAHVISFLDRAKEAAGGTPPPHDVTDVSPAPG